MSTYPPDGMAAFQAGNYAEAIQIFNKAVKEEPDNSRLYNAIGMCYAKLNKKENARAAFESALMIDPDNVTYQRNIERIEPKPVPVPLFF